LPGGEQPVGCWFPSAFRGDLRQSAWPFDFFKIQEYSLFPADFELKNKKAVKFYVWWLLYIDKNGKYFNVPHSARAFIKRYSVSHRAYRTHKRTGVIFPTR
jgi:hypothetical protein